MLQNCQPRRNFKSCRSWRRFGRPEKPAMAATAANWTTVRLSSGISANILDFGIPQKHVLTGMLAQAKSRPIEPAGLERQAGAGNRASSDSRKQENEFEIRNPACGESGVREGAHGKARRPGLRPDLHRSHGDRPLQSGEGLA